MKKRIALLYEHIAREYSAVNTIAAFLNHMGIEARIFSLTWRLRDAIQFEPDVLAVPWCYDQRDYNRFIARFLKRKPMVVVNLHQEQIGSAKSVEFLLPKDPWSRNLVHFCWSNQFARQLLSTGVPPEKIFVVGNPRLDNLRKKSRISRAAFAERHGLNPSKTWVLFIDNTAGLADIRAKTSTELGERGYRDIEAVIRAAERALGAIADSLEHLAEEDQVEVVFRPHPGHQIDKKRFKRVKVIADGTIMDWASYIDLAVVWTSTGAFETALMDVPTVRFEPEPVNRELMPSGLELFPVVRSYDELRDMLLSRDRNVDTVTLKSQLRHIVGPVDGFNSFRSAYALSQLSSTYKIALFNKTNIERLWILKDDFARQLSEAQRRLGVFKFTKWPRFYYSMLSDHPSLVLTKLKFDLGNDSMPVGRLKVSANNYYCVEVIRHCGSF